jgi:hypothetical protein
MNEQNTADNLLSSIKARLKEVSKLTKKVQTQLAHPIVNELNDQSAAVNKLSQEIEKHCSISNPSTQARSAKTTVVFQIQWSAYCIIVFNLVKPDSCHFEMYFMGRIDFQFGYRPTLSIPLAFKTSCDIFSFQNIKPTHTMSHSL